MKTGNTPASLKGMAKHTYNRVMSAMAEDSDPAMLHTFAALTDGAKAIALQSGNFSNLYIRGINKGMTAEEAANELTERAAALVSRKLRKIDMICAAAFLAEYISRQRKEAEQPEPTNPDNTPANVTFTEYTGETDWRNNVETINVNGVEYGIRVRRMHGLNPARDGEYYVIYMPDEAKAEQLEAALKAAGHKATPDEYGVIVRTWAAFMAGVEMLNQEQPAPEFSELTHAGQCLDIYLHNTAEIYDRYTVPAIRKVAAMMRSNATHPQQVDVSPAGVSGLWEVIRAISAAAGLVRKYDKLAPTQDDKKQATRNYAVYIVDCAKYEIEK